MLLPNFYHPFFLYCVKTPTNDDGNFGELEFLCTFVAKSKPLSKTRQSIANRTVSKSLPEHQPIVRNTLLQRVVAFLSKVTQKNWMRCRGVRNMSLQEFGVMRFVLWVDDFDEISHRGREWTEVEPLWWRHRRCVEQRRLSESFTRAFVGENDEWRLSQK